MKHLVLGSEGQVGKYVCDEIEANGDEVVRWDIELNENYDLSSLDQIGESFYRAALYNLGAAMRNSDFVHFLAYEVGGSKYLAAKQNSFEYISTNMRIMEVVFQHLKWSGKPFYFASSQMSNMTDSVYGQLKAVGESYTRALGGTNVRFWNVYGYESDLEKSHVITDFIRMMFEEGRIICRTNGHEERHFTYASDAAKILYMLAWRMTHENTDEYHMGSYNVDYTRLDFLPVANINAPWVSMRRLAEYIYDIFAEKDLVVAEEIEKNLLFSLKADNIQNIKNEIPWYPNPADNCVTNFEFTNLKDGLREMIELIGKDYA